MEITAIQVVHYGKDGAAINKERIVVVDDTAKITIPVTSASVLVHDDNTGKFICKITG
jgi:hypothetical protein